MGEPGLAGSSSPEPGSRSISSASSPSALSSPACMSEGMLSLSVPSSDVPRVPPSLVSSTSPPSSSPSASLGSSSATPSSPTSRSRSVMSWRASLAKAPWSSTCLTSSERSAPALDCTQGRHRSITRWAHSGGASPVIDSRAIRRITSTSDTSSLSARSRPLRWKLSSSMADRLWATPSIRRAPIASTRACSIASKISRAAWPCGA